MLKHTIPLSHLVTFICRGAPVVRAATPDLSGVSDICSTLTHASDEGAQMQKHINTLITSPSRECLT